MDEPFFFLFDKSETAAVFLLLKATRPSFTESDFIIIKHTSLQLDKTKYP